MRIGKIEIMRFLGSIFIMIGHMGYIGCYSDERPFSKSWFFVEFFLMLTGYLTTRHFKRIESDNIVKESIVYTINKFKRFLPYTVPAVLLMYFMIGIPLLEQGDKLGFVKNFENMPYEILFLSAANKDGTLLFPIWFLSAMFLVFPLFCIVIQMKNKSIVLLVSFYLSIIYYLHVYDFGSHEYPNQMVRAFCGMMLGVLIFYITEWMKSVYVSNNWKTVLSLIELISFLVLILMSYKNIVVLRYDLLIFFFILVCIFSNQSYIPYLSNYIFDFLGKLSMPIFIWHVAVAQIINHINFDNDSYKILYWFVMTFLISIINIIISNKISGIYFCKVKIDNERKNYSYKE